MDIASQKSVTWHLDILPRKTKKAFDFLSREKWLEKSNWYLAGGTALALQSGNRKSYDLDFFTTDRDFDEKRLLDHFIENPNWKSGIEEKNTIYGELLGAKVSFIAYPFFIPAQEKIPYDSISVLHPIDIAVMKITAISQRGRKRDFFDLYWCAKNLEPLEQTIKRLKKQYPSIAHDYHHILKSLTYFEDAESDPEPEINFSAQGACLSGRQGSGRGGKADWKEVKKFFLKEIPNVMVRVIGLDKK